MKINIKNISLLAGVIIFSGLTALGIKFFLDTSYRNKLPKYPDLVSISKSLREQIKEAGSKAYYNPTVKNLGNLGLVYHANGYSEKAVACYQLAIDKSAKNNSREWVWSYYLGCLNLEKGESKAAIENFREVIVKSPSNFQALYYRGEANQNLGYAEEAKRIFKYIYSLNGTESTVKKTSREFYFPVQIHAGYSLARIYLNSNQPDSAGMIIKEVIKKSWTFGPAYHLLGEVYAKKGDAELSKKFYIRANDLITNIPYADTLLDKLALLSRSDKYLINQIESAKSSFNFKRAYQVCLHAIKYLPENKYIISNFLSICFYLGREKEALPLLNKHFEFFKDDYDEMFKFANLLYKDHETEALKYFEQAKKLQPENSGLAVWLLERSKKDEAIRLIDQQLQKDPANERILTDAVHLYVTFGNREKAKILIASLQERYPKNVEAKKATGLLMEMDGNLKDAIPVYEEVAKEKDLSIVKYLASLYLRYQNWEKAIRNFKSGLENFPNETDLLEPLGRLLISCPDPRFLDIEAGKEYSERAYIHINCPVGTRILAARNLATAYAILGDKQKAANYINITLNMVQQINANPQEYLGYFQMLRQKYNLS